MGTLKGSAFLLSMLFQCTSEAHAMHRCNHLAKESGLLMYPPTKILPA